MKSINLKPYLMAIMALCFTSLALARIPGNAPVTPDKVTDEELYVIAKWEDAALWRGDKEFSEIHYPIENGAAGCTQRGCLNGCTIGYGYNFGAHSAAKIRADFKQAGIANKKTEKFVPLAGVTGLDAVVMCGSQAPMRQRFPHLTQAESQRLLRIMVLEHKRNVVGRARRENTLKLFNSGQFSVMVALDYQNTGLSSEATYIWRQLKRGDMDAVLDNIRHHMGTRFAPTLQWRRDWEADYFAWATSRQLASGNYGWPPQT